jgi:hypothetical protein
LAFEQFTESHSPLNSGKPRKFAQNAKSRIDWRITAEAAERFVDKVEDLLGRCRMGSNMQHPERLKAGADPVRAVCRLLQQN